METPPLLVVAGPTASGKSSLAIKLAQDFNAEIISVDSLAVYREFDIGSAKPSQHERSVVSHHLIDIVDPPDLYNVAQFVKHAKEAITQIQARGKNVILVGGTSLYLSSLWYGLADLPPANLELRQELELLSAQELHLQLIQKDPLSAQKIHPNDKLRLVRALESLLISGQPMSQGLIQQRERLGQLVPKYGGVFVIPCWKRSELYARIDSRTQQMFALGLVEETRQIVSRHGSDLQGLRALGYSQALQVLQGALPLAEATELVARETRNFAKRQMTFWRNEPLKRAWKVRPQEIEQEKVIGLEDSSTIPPSRKNQPKSFRALDLEYRELRGLLNKELEKPQLKNQCWYIDARGVL